MPRNLIAAVAVSTCLALLVSFLPALTTSGEHGVAVFQPVTPILLTEQNLVDLFTLSPTHYNIKRVKWENQSLFVDFLVKPDEQVDDIRFYTDVYSLIYRSFQLTRNVESVFFRLVEGSETRTEKLLVAIQAQRPKSLYHLPEPDQLTNVRQFVEGLFEIRVEPGTEERFRSSSKSMVY